MKYLYALCLSFSLSCDSRIYNYFLVTILYGTNSLFENIWFIDAKCNYNCIGRIREIKYAPSFPQPLRKNVITWQLQPLANPGRVARDSQGTQGETLRKPIPSSFGFRISRSATAFISGLEIVAMRANVTVSDWLR